MIYGILSTIAFIIILPFWLVAGIFKPKFIAGFREKIGFYGEKIHFTQALSIQGGCEQKKQNIIFYGVSVGEVIAMENLIKKTRETFSNVNIIVLTGTKTGQEIAHKKLGEVADLITYFPFDFPFCVNNMINKMNPDAIFVMETELWPNFANITNKKKIPFYIINARISDRTYKSYKKLSFIFGQILKKYTGIFPQSKQDAEKLISIGANPQTTEIMGNLKFDIKKPDISTLDFEKNPQHQIILAGSTHAGEDEIILDSFCELKKEIKDLKLIIASRHPERNEKVFALMKQTGFKCEKRSTMLTPHSDPNLSQTTHQGVCSAESQGVSENSKNSFQSSDIILLDTMGELGKFYSICDIAFIGGSFNKTGGHNPLEAAIFKKPVLSGPSIHNFKDIYAILTNTDAGKIVKTNAELTESLRKMLLDKEFYQKASNDCEEVFEQNKGALKFVIKVLQTIV